MDFQIARKTMVDSQVRPNDVMDIPLQLAMEEIPREIFLPGTYRELAYAEQEHVYGNEGHQRVMLKPRDFAKLLAHATPRSGELVLDIGCGTGYSTAILSRLCEMVVAVEADEALHTNVADNMSNLKIDNFAVVQADLDKGIVEQGPYDLIFIGAGIARKPDVLLNQLKDGGRLAAIWRGDLANGGSRRGVLYKRQGDVFSRIDLFEAGSGALLEPFAAKPEFRF